MNDLRALYRTLLRDRRATLAVLRARTRLANATTDAAEAWTEILRLAHKLKGTGGQVGFPEITEAALALREAPSSERPAHLEALLGVIDAALQDDPVSTPGLAAPDAAGHILLVEDDPLIASVIRNALGRHGLATTHHAEGARALEALAERPTPFDLAVLDVSMPEVSGLDVLAHIRRTPHTTAMPVMMVSAHADAATITHAREQGADDYVTKPFTPERLLRHVRALLQADAQQATRGGA